MPHRDDARRRDDRRPGAISRRRLLGLAAGTAVVGGAVGSRLWAQSFSGPIDDAATATARAVRVDTPPPPGAFRRDARYVALYGHPGSPVLGSLGEQDVQSAVWRASLVAQQYLPLDRPVVAAFEIITTVASSAAGPDGDYSNEFPASKFTPWIDAAAANGMHVVLDLQPGRATFPSQTREIAGLLRAPHVSLALDPEWRVGPTERPGGGFVGTVDAAEVNETVAVVDQLIRDAGLPDKMLVVHQFSPSMVTNKQAIRGTPRVQVLFQMDGFGTLARKRGSWDRMVADLPPGAFTGWKNFYDEDSPTPTPAESVAVSPAPSYISYQ